MAFRMPLRWRMAVRPAAVPKQSFSAPRFQLQRRGYASEGGKSSGNIKFWPFFGIIGIGTLGYIGLVNRRKGELSRSGC